jgi:hypothetical protein
VDAAGRKRFAATRLWFAQLVAFSALGWLVAGILDAAGALRLTDASLVGIADRAGFGVPLSQASALAVVSAVVAAAGLVAAAVAVG